MSYSEITKKYRASLSESECKALDIIGERLCETNKVMNLTALTDERGVGLLHFWDSLTLIDTELFTAEEVEVRVTGILQGSSYIYRAVLVVNLADEVMSAVGIVICTVLRIGSCYDSLFKTGNCS